VSEQGEPLAEPILDDQGEQLGWIIQADDGALLEVDLDGTIVAANDPETDEPLDHEVYRWADQEPDPFEVYDQRLEALEEYATRPVEVPEMQVTRGLEQADVQRIDADLHRQADHLEALLGRSLTLAEKRRIATEVANQIDAGEMRPDVLYAASQLGDRGQGLRDLDHPNAMTAHANRVAHMVERLEDEGRYRANAEGTDDLRDEAGPPRRTTYDLDDVRGGQRLDWMVDQLEGRLDPETARDVAYHSSDYEEEP